MGSTDNEPGRSKDEGPRRRVMLTGGLWLGQVPVTQALWTALGDENPSRFRDPERPVERVSWDRVGAWLLRVNEARPEFALRLPSEAEWEYACRAGTETATYAGPIEILGDNHAPVLDAIAWYGGNSGVDYELKEADDSSGWFDRQYPHTRAGTRRVGLKAANRWGLRDMLGNVWEWCEDAWRDLYPDEDETNPVYRGGKFGALRVVRGGSWLDRARGARAACRNGAGPGDRGDGLGFRLARDP
jgi:formylglycine-generating enzyme required for sulfatase activity